MPVEINTKRGNFTDNPCWYASVTDAGNFALVLGPFPTEAAARTWAYRDPADGGDAAKHKRMSDVAQEHDPKSWFYAWGMVQMKNGYRDGVLNKYLPEAEREMRQSASSTKQAK